VGSDYRLGGDPLGLLHDLGGSSRNSSLGSDPSFADAEGGAAGTAGQLGQGPPDAQQAERARQATQQAQRAAAEWVAQIDASLDCVPGARLLAGAGAHIRLVGSLIRCQKHTCISLEAGPLLLCP
jgi:hypothetical protein